MSEEFNINTSIEMNREPVKTVEISQEDKERFFKSIISDVPYEEVMHLFDEQLKVRFKVMTVKENSDVVGQIVNDKKNGLSSDTDAYFITIASYRLALSLATIDDKPYSSITKDNFSPSHETDTYVLARAKLLSSWSTSKLSVFLDAFQRFESKVLKLTSEAQTANFWKASV
jgi:hypothetical protein